MEGDIGPRHLTILKCRPPRRPGQRQRMDAVSTARRPYTQAPGTWTLYWRDRYLCFHRYDQVEPSPDIGGLLREIDHDPIAIFWG